MADSSSSMEIGLWGIFITMILPSIGGLGYLSWLVYEYIRQHYIVSFNINTSQPCYEWIVLWMRKYGPLKQMQHLTLTTKVIIYYITIIIISYYLYYTSESHYFICFLQLQRERIQWYNGGLEEQEDERMKNLEINWWPRPIIHYFWHHTSQKFVWFQLKRDENDRNVFYDWDTNGAKQKEYETLTFWAFGTSTKIWEDLLLEAKLEFNKNTEKNTIIYRWSKYANLWRIHGGKTKDIRPWKSIVTQSNIKQDIRNDIKKFRESSNSYKSLGIPYKRGYLLHGPPGTGKSSLVYGLAGELGLSICVLTLSDRDLSDDELMNRLVSAPKNSIILIEDIDVALPSEKRKTELEVENRRKKQAYDFSNHYSGSLTLSGVLNSIDGVATADSQILIMTTNHKENLDPALIRPGR